MTTSSATPELITIEPKPGAVISSDARTYSLVRPHLEFIIQAKTTIAELQAQVRQHEQQVVSIGQQCRHPLAALVSPQEMVTTTQDDIYFRRSTGSCLDCAATVDCCPRCGNKVNTFYKGRWQGAGDFNEAHQFFIEMGGSFDIFSGGKITKLYGADCSDCQISWYWTEQEDIEW